MTELPAIERLTKDLRLAASTLSDAEARYLVDAYYQMQKDRIRADLRMSALERDESDEPHSVIAWLSSQSSTLENQIKGALDRYAQATPVGRWLKSVKGVGPVISAGYLANCDIKRLATVGAMWAHCGVAPGKDRPTKGTKLPYNPSLKRLTYITGECFKRQGDDAYYRRVYDARKAYENQKNEAGDYAEQARNAITVKRYGDDTKAKSFYLAGKLPPGHIDRRCARYAAKLFLAHLHQIMWQHEYGDAPPMPYPLPYAVAHLGHAHVILPP